MLDDIINAAEARDRRPPSAWQTMGAAGLVFAVATLGGSGAVAQSGGTVSMPGLVISVPDRATPPQAPPPQATPAPTPAPSARPRSKAKPRAKAKSQPKATRQASRAPTSDAKQRGQGIVLLVNDEPITAYEIDQRAALMGLSANIGPKAQEAFKRIAQNPSTNARLKAILEETIRANQGKSRQQIIAAFEARKKAFVIQIQKQALSTARAGVLPGLRAKATEELIEEKLKLQEGKRLSIVITKDEVDKLFKGIADRNKLSLDKFIGQLRSQGIDPETMKARMKAGMVWRDVLRKRFGHQVSVTGREVDRLIESSGAATGEDSVELQLQKITLSIPGRIDQRAMARRLAEAEGLRRKFGGCKTIPALAQGLKDAKYENLGGRAASTIPEPTRSLLLNAKDGEMVPPSLGAAGVELYAVCGRKIVKVDDQKRLKAQEELTMREFELLSRRHLRDLRTDALIERR